MRGRAKRDPTSAEREGKRNHFSFALRARPHATRKIKTRTSRIDPQNKPPVLQAKFDFL